MTMVNHGDTKVGLQRLELSISSFQSFRCLVDPAFGQSKKHRRIACRRATPGIIRHQMSCRFIQSHRLWELELAHLED